MNTAFRFAIGAVLAREIALAEHDPPAAKEMALGRDPCAGDPDRLPRPPDPPGRAECHRRPHVDAR